MRIINTLTEKLDSLKLGPPTCLPFSPTEEKQWLLQTFDDIPRYLFRIFNPKSQGATDTFWTKSMGARWDREGCTIDIFSKADDQVADMLYRHLRWWPGRPDDNLVSWTSSLLFALQYIFHLHINERNTSSFEDICLCVLDTTSFDPGVFIRDMDLIQAYQSHDDALNEWAPVRRMKHKQLSGSYYFGEYFSQGALKIEGACQIVSAREIIDKGLYDLIPDFRTFGSRPLTPRAPWADEVLRLREEFYLRQTRQQCTREEIRAAINIAALFGLRWRLPIAANLLALRPRLKEDGVILKAFGTMHFTDEERQNCSSALTKITAYGTLPEVEQFSLIMKDVYHDHCLRKLKGHLLDAELSLRHALISIHTRTALVGREHELRPSLDTLVLLSQVLQEELEGGP